MMTLLDRLTKESPLPSGTIDEAVAKAWLAPRFSRAEYPSCSILPATSLLSFSGKALSRYLHPWRVPSPPWSAANATPHLLAR